MDVKRCSEVRRRIALAQAALQHLVEADDARGDAPVFGSGAGRGRFDRCYAGLRLRFSALTTPSDGACVPVPLFRPAPLGSSPRRPAPAR